MRLHGSGVRPSLLLPLLGLLACSQTNNLGKVDKSITVSPTLVDLGDVAVGSTTGADVTLTHTGGDPVTIVDLQLITVTGGGFSVGMEPGFTVDTDAPVSLPIVYTPTEEGWDEAQLTIFTDEPEDAEHLVDLRGHAIVGTLSVDPVLYDFGAVAVDSTETGTVTLTNTGELPLTISGLETDDVVFAATTSTPFELGAHEDTTVELSFSPTDLDPATGTLSIVVGETAGASVTLRGNDCEEGDPTLYDEDGDGWSVCGGDCDDADPDAHSGGTETCDGTDEDCNGIVDDGTSCYDDDGDGWTEDDGDCDDSDAQINPAQPEDTSNGVDDNCDGVVDLGTDDPDGDGYTSVGGDCREGDATVHPGADETCNGVDDDCDGVIDEGTECYDDDGDGYTENAGDCDDTDPSTYTGASEGADGVDNDCDGTVDQGTDWYDDDGDGWTERGGDCDDTDATRHPGIVDTPGDGIDNDCDGVTE